MKVIVIGSGIGGLTAAASLAKAGTDVLVLEQYHSIGGVTGRVQRDGFRWDLGQLLLEGFGADEPSGSVLKELGVLSQIQTRVEDRTYIFPDFAIQKPETYQGVGWRMKELKRLFPEDAGGIDRYFRDYLRFTKLMTLGRALEKAEGFEKRWLQARLTWTMLPFLSKKDWSAERLMKHYFKNPKLQCVFISILADFFTPPSQFMGLGVFALNPEASFEARMPRQLADDTVQLYHYSILGGMATVVDALEEVIETHGGQIETGREVKRILVEGGRVQGVMDADGNRLAADVVIASGGARETFLSLVGEEALPGDLVANVKDLPLMDSVFMVHIGITGELPDVIRGPVTYFYGSYDVEGEIRKARAGEYHEGAAGFVVHVPSLHSPEMAPEGHHAVTIYTIAPNHLAEGSWGERKLELAKKLLDYADAQMPGLKDAVMVQVVMTPEDFRGRCHIDPHAFGGIAPVLGMKRIAHRTPVEGLWFVGAQSESGGGVNTIIPSAYRVAKEILSR